MLFVDYHTGMMTIMQKPRSACNQLLAALNCLNPHSCDFQKLKISLGEGLDICVIDLPTPLYNWIQIL